METSRLIELAGGLLALIGTVFLAAAVVRGRRAAPEIPPELSRRWRLMTGLMAFFLTGYLLFVGIVLLQVAIAEVILVGLVFLGGAVFVFAMIDLASRVVRRFRSVEAELRSLNATLEQRVNERSRVSERRALQLQTTAEIARLAVQSRDPGPLLVQATDLIKERFGFYHASVFLVDDTGGWAVLRASTGDAGRGLLARGHRLAVGSASLVGWVSENRLPRVSNDVGADPFHLPNPLLPDTRAEMALPMIVGPSLIGVIDVQSTEAEAFAEEDVRALEAIAGELAIALENARLLSQTAEEIEEAEGVFQGRARQSWARFAQSGIPTVFRVGAGDGVFHGASHELSQLAVAGGRTARSPDGMEVAVPVLVRGEAIATIAARRPPEVEPWNDDDIGLIEAAASQVGLALESARQYAEEQRRVAELEVVNRVSQAVSQLLRLDSLYRVVHAQMVQVLPHTDLGIGLYEAATDQMVYPFWAEENEISERPLTPVSNDLAGYILRTRQPLTLAGDLPAQAEGLGIELPDDAPRSWMGAPLLAGDTLMGLIFMQDRREAERFSDDDAALLATIASQVATAIQNHRLFDETQRAARRERLIHEITSKIRRAPDIRSILDTTAREVGRALSASRATVRLGMGTAADEPAVGTPRRHPTTKETADDRRRRLPDNPPGQPERPADPDSGPPGDLPPAGDGWRCVPANPAAPPGAGRRPADQRGQQQHPFAHRVDPHPGRQAQSDGPVGGLAGTGGRTPGRTRGDCGPGDRARRIGSRADRRNRSAVQ